MKPSQLIVGALVCAATLLSVAVTCAAQTGSPPAGESTTPATKTAQDETVQTPPAAPNPPSEPAPSTAAPPLANPPEPSVAPANGPAVVPTLPEDALPPRKKTPAEPKPAGEARGEPDPKVKPYVIGPLDVLYVRVWNQQNLTGMQDVGPDGTISMPLIGEIKADGLTVADLKTVITQKLNDCCLNDPDVSVQVTRINSKSVLLIGGVGHPGKFPLTEKTTVLDALVGSGGFREFANQKKIYILRDGKKIFFNYKDVIQGKHVEQNIELQNGDRIVVPE
jgi:polysaccharide export outer membrane protein